MKKKGLIISTVVMVVVLIASLTTATYAWFTADGAASVNDIGFQVQSSSDLVIGLSKTNTLLTENIDNSKFVSDGTVFNAPDGEHARGSWTTTSGGDGLGLKIDTGLQLTNVTEAVYSFTGSGGSDQNQWSGYRQDNYLRGNDASTVTTGMKRDTTILKAKGNGYNITANSLRTANMNGWGVDAEAVTGDYLDVVFGVRPQKSNVKSYGCLITVTNSNAGNNVGLSAALHAIWSTGGAYTEVDLYGTSTCGQSKSSITAPAAQEKKYTVDSTEKTFVYSGQKATNAGDATYFIPLDSVENWTDNLGIEDSNIKQLHLIIYLCGPDGDCKSGYSANATISIQFVSINEGTVAKA